MTHPIKDASTPIAAKRSSASLRMAYTLAKISIFAIEMVAIAFLVLGRLEIGTALIIHFALGGALVAAILVIERAGYNAGQLQSYALQMLVAGPLGAASAMIGEQLVGRARIDRLIPWYETLAPAPEAVVTLADRIIDDQLVRREAKLPKSVDRLIMSGSMREKQALFASIISDGRIEGVNLIEKALRSRDQRVRVQAAAVSAFIRSKLRKSAGVPYSNTPVTGAVPAPANDDVKTPAA